MMLFDWQGRPALMMPALAYAVTRPGQAWTRTSAERVAREAQPLTEQEFWTQFGAWNLPDFPVAFVALDRRPGAAWEQDIEAVAPLNPR